MASCVNFDLNKEAIQLAAHINTGLHQCESMSCPGEHLILIVNLLQNVGEGFTKNISMLTLKFLDIK